jgi:hypothetical protein
LESLRDGDPQQVGPYRLLAQVGTGSLGTVFAGMQTFALGEISAVGPVVAVRVLRADIAGDPEFRLRLRQELQAAARVHGPHLASILDADLNGPVPYIVSAYVDGPSLESLISRNGPLPESEAAALAAGLAEGLSAIHAAGIAHRDLKPGNVLLSPDGPRITDVGLAGAMTAPGSSLTSAAGATAVLGTAGFLSPEAIEEGSAGPASDIFALGVLLTYAATGRMPFGEASNGITVLLYRVVTAEPDLAGVPDTLRALIARCLAKDPGQRPTAAQLVALVATAYPDGGTWRAVAQSPKPNPGPPAATTVAAAPPAPPAPNAAGHRRAAGRKFRKDQLWTLALLGVLLVVIAGLTVAAWQVLTHAFGVSPAVAWYGAPLMAVGGFAIAAGAPIAIAAGAPIAVGWITAATSGRARRRDARRGASRPPSGSGRPAHSGPSTPGYSARDPDGGWSGGGDWGPAQPGPPDTGGGDGPASRRYLRARCPEVVGVGRPFSLIASIGQASAGESALLRAFSVPATGTDVLLVLHAPGLRLLGDHRLPVHVPPAGNSDPVMFELRAEAPGPRSVSLTAWLAGTYLGELAVDITAADIQAAGEHREYRAEIDTEASDGAVSLVVRYDTDLRAYRFEFRDQDNPGEVVSRLSFEPRPRIECLVADLDRLAAGRTGYSAGQARDYLVNAGAELWRELVPPGLREQFWDRQHRIRQLTILADRDTVPWELLYPRDAGHDAGFLVEQFPVTRAVFGRRLAPRLSLSPARFVLPRGSLPQAASEVDVMRRLLDPVQPSEAVISDLDSLQDLIRRGEFGLLHFACHNRFEPDENASIKLGSVQFTPRLMTTAVIDRVLERSAPTVFLNACRSAGLAPTYNRLDGWASKFLEAGAGAFIGSQWAVSDGTAREFAEDLYGQLKAGATLGAALMHARGVAATHADDPTWLAYTAYGDPRARAARPRPLIEEQREG